MFGLSQAKLIGGGVALLGIALFIAWALRVDNLRGRYLSQINATTAVIGESLGNPRLKWKDVGQQVKAYVDGHNALVEVSERRNVAIAALGKETERLKALSASVAAKASILIAERGKLIDQLKRSAQEPGDASDLQAQIAAAQEALNAVYEEGL